MPADLEISRDLGCAEAERTTLMTTPHSSTRIDGIPITPVEWLARGRGVQPLVEILGVRRLM